MAAPTAWAQNPKATRSQLSPSPHICTVLYGYRVPSGRSEVGCSRFRSGSEIQPFG
jgi:hypothetical protein